MPGEADMDGVRELRAATDEMRAALKVLQSVPANIESRVVTIEQAVERIDRTLGGNGEPGMNERVRLLERDFKKRERAASHGGEKWKALGQIAVAVVAALSLYLQLSGG